MRAHLHQRVLHLVDHLADHLLGILGAVEHRVEVGIDDVGKAGKDPHLVFLLSIWPGAQPTIMPITMPARNMIQWSALRLRRKSRMRLPARSKPSLRPARP